MYNLQASFHSVYVTAHAWKLPSKTAPPPDATRRNKKYIGEKNKEKGTPFV